MQQKHQTFGNYLKITTPRKWHYDIVKRMCEQMTNM